MVHESSAKLLQISEYSWKLFSWTYTLNGQATVRKSNKAKETFWTTALDYISQFILHRPFHREDCLCTHSLQIHLMMHRYVKRHNVIFALERTLCKCPNSPSVDIGHTYSWHAIIFTESHGLRSKVSDPKRRIPHYIVNECPVYDHMVCSCDLPRFSGSNYFYVAEHKSHFPMCEIGRLYWLSQSIALLLTSAINIWPLL